MKNRKKELFYNILIYIIFLIFLIDNPSLSIITGKYSYTKRLNNGNYVIVSSRNITFVDPTFSIVYNSKNFDSEMYDSIDKLGSTTISQFSANHKGFVIVVLVTNIYVFSSNGEYLNETNINFNDPRYPCFIITHGYLEDNFFFTLIYANNNNISLSLSNNIDFIKTSFILSTKEIIFSNGVQYYPPNINSFYTSSLSCNTMIKDSKELITCIFGTSTTSYITIFDPEDNYKFFSMKTVDLGSQIIKSVVLPDERKKVLFCGFKSIDYYLNCLNYDITTNITTEIQALNYSCGYKSIYLIMEYFYETENFIVGCKGSENEVYLNEFSHDMIKSPNDYIYNNDYFPSDCGNIGRMNIVIPQGGSKYNFYFNKNSYRIDGLLSETILLELDLELSNFHIYPTTESSILICSGNLYYNYEHTECISLIPPGYYCNSTSQRTIDSCHPNCQTCDKGPTNDNNNCLTCKDSGNFYFDLGNCITECSQGTFIHNGTEKCKCSTDTSCEYCSEESKRQNLCETCNTNFYPKKDDINNNGSLIKCYNNDSISIGYYLNTNSSKYEPCHSNCLECSGAPTDSNNNCITCPDSGKIYFNLGNCTESCIHGTYIDENSIPKCKCTNNIKCKECTELSLNLDLCISCNNEEGYYPKFEDERNSVGFINCYKNPSRYFLTTINGEAYYKKCYETCSSCDELGDETNNKCKECIPDYIFKNDFENDKNCYEHCSHKYYYDSDRKHFCIDECPQTYNKLISSKQRCIDDCSKDNSNLLYEYNNECVLTCPENTHSNSDNPYK